MVPVAGVSAGAASATDVGRVVSLAGATRSVPVMEAEHGHRSQPGSAEGECEGVGVHGRDVPGEEEVYAKAIAVTGFPRGAGPGRPLRSRKLSTAN
jgi:hypothetical protein